MTAEVKIDLSQYFGQYADDDEDDVNLSEFDQTPKEELHNYSDNEDSDNDEEGDEPLVRPDRGAQLLVEERKKNRNTKTLNAVIKLIRRGATTVPVFEAKQVEQLRKSLRQEAAAFPEYLKPADPKTKYVLGGFGALGNPASFHNHTVRANREDIMKVAQPFFKTLVDIWGEMAKGDFSSIENKEADKLAGKSLTDGERKRLRKSASKIISKAEKYRAKNPGAQWMLEQVIDRMLLRRAGERFKGEDWHQDSSPFTLKRGLDYIFGGWIGFTPDLTEKFTFSEGSHSFGKRPYDSAETGFSKINELKKKDPKEYEMLTDTLKASQTVAPGSWCVFPQNLVHIVNPSEAHDMDIIRQFFGFRLVFGVPGKVKSLHHYVELAKGIDFKQDEALMNQGPFPQPSGEISRMYPRQEGSTGLYDRLIPWSIKTFKPQCLEERTIQPRTGDLTKEVKAQLPKSKTKTGKEVLDTKSPEYKQAKLQASEAAEKKALARRHFAVGTKYTVVQVWMKSLKALKLPLYDAYDPEELEMLRPMPLFEASSQERKKVLPPGEDTDDEEMEAPMGKGTKRPRSPSAQQGASASKRAKTDITPTPGAGAGAGPGFIDLTVPRHSLDKYSSSDETEGEFINIMD